MNIFTMLAAINAWSYVILVVYFAFLVGISVFSHKKSSSLNSFYLSNRGMSGWMSAFAYGTTYFSAVIFIGYAGKFGMFMGLSAVWIGIANGIIGAFLAWKVLAKRTRAMSQAIEARTMPEFFEKRYDSKYLKLYSSLIIFIFLIPYSTSVYQGLAYIIEAAYGIPFVWCVIIMASITAVYLFVGGYFAEALSDFIQGIIMILGVVAMLAFMLNSPQVGWADGFRKLTEMGYGLFPSFQSSGKFIDSPGFTLIIMCLLTSFGIWGLPQSIHKFYTIKDSAAIKRGTVISTIFALVIGGGAYLNGGFAHLFFLAGNPAPAADRVITTMFEQAGMPALLLSFIAVLVLSASMSTLSALSLSSSSTVSIDLYRGYIRKTASDSNVKVLMRCLCIVFIAVSAALAILQIDVIVTLMALSWGTIAGSFIGPYIYGLYSKKVNKVGVYASITFSLVLTLTLILVFGFAETPSGTAFGMVIKKGIGRSPIIGVSAMVSSMIVTPLASLVASKCRPSEKTIKTCFDAVKKNQTA
jgi:SSS family solute:Na+ symporter/sodium/proline symporter